MICRFEEIEVDWQARELRRGGSSVTIKPRAFHLLELLFDNRDRVVTKQQIFDEVWEGRIASDGALTTSVNELRKALGDTAQDGQIIRTYYGQGLRFVAEVETTGSDVQPTQPVPSSPKAEDAGQSAPSPDALDPNAKIALGLVVLAFENLSDDQSLGRLGEAIAEDLITALSKFAQLAVVSRTSSFAVSHQRLPINEITKHLDVEYVVEGSLRPLGDTVRVTVQLVHATSDQHVWAGQFDWPVDGSSEDQVETTGVITGQVIDQLTRFEGQRWRNIADEDLDSWQCYYRGITTKNTHKLRNRNDAIGYFERAVALNPDFGLARALLAYVLTLPVLETDEDGLQAVDLEQMEADLDRAESEAHGSLETDDRFPYAWVSLARVHNIRRNPKDGLRSVQNAIDLNPFQPVALFVMGECYLSNGQPEQAIEFCDKCLALGASSVFYPLALSMKACALVALKQYEDAIACSREAQARSASIAASFFGEISALGHLGHQEHASAAIKRAKSRNEGFSADLFDRLFRISNEQVLEHLHLGLRRADLA